jgi:hypothetical protein
VREATSAARAAGAIGGRFGRMGGGGRTGGVLAVAGGTIAAFKDGMLRCAGIAGTVTAGGTAEEVQASPC